MHSTRTGGPRVALLFALVLAATACSEAADDEAEDDTDDTTVGDDTRDEGGAAESGNQDDSDDTADDGDDDDSDDTADDGEAATASVVEMFAGEPWVFGAVPDAPVPADESLEPIRIGMVNLENSPAGSFPELRGAVDAAVTFVNTELSGVGGRPIELLSCVTEFSQEASRACAQELVLEGVVAMVGGIDITSDGAFPVYEQNGIPQLGGIPSNLVEQQSPVAFFFSGGTPGGMAAFVKHAADNGAERVLIAHGDFPSFTVAADDYGAAVARSLGMEVEVVPFSMLATDFLPVLSRALPDQFDADAVLMLAADTACVPIMDLFVELGLRETSQLYMFGACALEEVIQAAGDSIEGVILTSEGPSEPSVEGDIFDEVTARYATMPSQATGTVGFRGFMNLYGIMLELGPDAVGPEAILAAARAAVDRPSYWGHPYTCDGDQVPGLPALCAPQQTYMTVEDGELTLFGDWVDTVALFAAADIG